MTTPILVIGTGPTSVGPARFPQALARAGAEVSLLVPSNSLARHTRHVRRVGLVPAEAPAMQWVEALFAMIDTAAPRALVPGDAGALDLLMAIVLAPPPELRPERAAALEAQLVESLGPIDALVSSLDAVRRTEMMSAAGVRAPEALMTSSLTDALSFARSIDGPVALRSAGSRGARIVATEATLAVAFERLASAAAEGDAPRQVLVERCITGTTVTHHVAARNGRVLASACAEHVIVDPASNDCPTVLRFRDHADVARMADRAIDAMQASGCCALDMAVDASGEPWLIGVDRHVVPAMHVSHWLGADLAAAWLAALEERTHAGATGLPAGTSRLSVAFPQEWLRDRESAWLREQRVDVPWDDPELLEAILLNGGLPAQDG